MATVWVIVQIIWEFFLLAMTGAFLVAMRILRAAANAFPIYIFAVICNLPIDYWQCTLLLLMHDVIQSGMNHIDNRIEFKKAEKLRAAKLKHDMAVKAAEEKIAQDWMRRNERDIVNGRSKGYPVMDFHNPRRPLTRDVLLRMEKDMPRDAHRTKPLPDLDPTKMDEIERRIFNELGWIPKAGDKPIDPDEPVKTE